MADSTVDEAIRQRFGGLPTAAREGAHDAWGETCEGALALIIALDQFPRSLWRDTPACYGQDIKAARLALAGIANGDFDRLAPWEQAFFMISISHCEGPDHLERMEMLDAVTEGIVARLPEQLAALGEQFLAQQARVKGIIERFGRHPHRNEILGRPSTPDELAYIAISDFPHVRKPDEDAQ